LSSLQREIWLAVRSQAGWFTSFHPAFDALAARHGRRVIGTSLSRVAEAHPDHLERRLTRIKDERPYKRNKGRRQIWEYRVVQQPDGGDDV
jgi:hypothetical protein